MRQRGDDRRRAAANERGERGVTDGMEGNVHEPVNGWLHLVGAILAAAGLCVLVAEGAESGSLRHLIALGVFGTTALLLFAASALNHLAPRSRRSWLFQRLDHVMIYVYIAGTYTPVCLLVLRGRAASTVLLLVVWTMAAAGVAQKLLWFRAPRSLSTALYIAMGWVGILALPALRDAAPPGLLPALLLGGVLYTVGAVVYWSRWPRGVPGRFGFHELWHVFVLAASATHYWAILTYVAPLA